MREKVHQRVLQVFVHDQSKRCTLLESREPNELSVRQKFVIVVVVPMLMF